MAITVATEYGLTQWLTLGTIIQGWAMAAQGQGEAAVGQIEQGLATLRAIGASGTGAAAMAAEAYGGVGQIEAGLALLVEALASVGRKANGMGRPSCIGSRGNCSAVHSSASRRAGE